jgi:hypothetical protein
MPASALVKSIAAPVRRYFNPRFDQLNSRMDSLDGKLDAIGSRFDSYTTIAEQRHRRHDQDDHLARVDVSAHNAASPSPATFSSLQSRAVSAAECDDERYQHWFDLMSTDDANDIVNRRHGVGRYNRKTWEYAFIVEAWKGCGATS